MTVVGPSVEQSRFSRRLGQRHDCLERNLARAFWQHPGGIVIGEIAADAIPGRAAISRPKNVLVTRVDGCRAMRRYEDRRQPLRSQIILARTNGSAPLRTIRGWRLRTSRLGRGATTSTCGCRNLQVLSREVAVVGVRIDDGRVFRIDGVNGSFTAR